MGDVTGTDGRPQWKAARPGSVFVARSLQEKGPVKPPVAAIMGDVNGNRPRPPITPSRRLAPAEPFCPANGRFCVRSVVRDRMGAVK